MTAQSAGILMYRHGNDGIEVLLVHPGGPFWRDRDFGAWSIPKGEHDCGENAESAARREFEEELGVGVGGLLESLGEVRQRAGKIVRGYALAGDLDVRKIRCNDVAASSKQSDHVLSRNRSRRVVRSSAGPKKDSRKPAAVSRSS